MLPVAPSSDSYNPGVSSSPDAPRLLSAARVVAVMHRYHGALTTYSEALNRLNVYPVPDGDTGTNMALTVGSVVEALEDASSMEEVAEAIAHGSLMGARGNSGIILSQILRGLADTFRTCERVGSPEFTEALTSASAAAYEAVVRPVEGTILTVVRAAADGARDVGTAAGDDLGEVLQRVYGRAEAALAATPDLLPVLRDAGVVDAGGAGLLLLLASFVEETTGATVPLPSSILDAAAATAPIHTPVDHAPDVAGLRYEVMFFLEAADDRVPDFRETWAGLGDSIAVVGGDGTYNCHIHTDHIGASIEAGITAGRPFDIRVTDLLEQAGDVAHHADAAGSVAEAHRFTPIDAVAGARVGVVAVAAGAGIIEMFRELGVQAVVSGGQSMNPSTEDLLAAVDGIDSPEVVVLPNNKNIVPVAGHVDALTDKPVHVVPTTSVPQGIAAMFGYVPGGTIDDVIGPMTEEAGSVVSGEVTQAVRAAATPAGPVSQGQWLGLVDGIIASVDGTPEAALTSVVLGSVRRGAELVTVILGADATVAMTSAARTALQDRHPELDVQVVEGGQPLYPFVVSVE